MHEMSLCESILQVVESAARRDGFTRVTRVRLEIGRLAGVEIASMRFGFDAVTRDTLAEGAVLDIIEQPGIAWCLPCGRQVEVQRRFDPCPACGSFQLQVIGGEQMQIRDLEVE